MTFCGDLTLATCVASGEDAARLLTPRAAPAAAPAASSPPQPFMHVGRRTDTADAREADAELRAHGRTDLQPHVRTP